MRTFAELRKDPDVLEAAVTFDHGIGNNLKLSYMRLMQCFLGPCAIEKIATSAGTTRAKLAEYYEKYFGQFLDHKTVIERQRWNARNKRQTHTTYKRAERLHKAAERHAARH